MDKPFTTLNELPHIDTSNLCGRKVYLIPLWDKVSWKTWTPIEDGNLLELSLVGVLRSDYLAEAAAHKDDVYIPFIELVWQHLSWPNIMREMSGLATDIHLMATIAAKLEHYHAAQEAIGKDLLTTFVNSEVEHLLVIARSMFDLLQAMIAHLWIEHVRIDDPALEKSRKQRPMQATFSKIVLDGQKLRTATEIQEKYSIPAVMAEMYVKHAPFFQSVRTARDHVVHYGKSTDSVYATERGFCVNPNAPYFRDFPWLDEHHYNENIVTLKPWLARLVGQTLEACSDILLSINNQIGFPPPLAPRHHVFIRDPAAPALLRLIGASDVADHWWADIPNDTNEGEFN
ncbi:hypothetical protein [Agrobacterium tumefaciens]|uniref:hypothetical protein n=1 Tax=Agrobacterium tumefaciens TaxID=358 RepID=UPI001574E830|nr:hypothetical protein [Agrobacterium tumefaciens]NTB05770.1 hypothetical protein [Agrobacterium tumefaciens]